MSPSLRAIMAEGNVAVRARRQKVVTLASGRELAGELDPWVEAHRRRYDFAAVAADLGLHFALRLACAFAEIASGLKSGTAKSRFKALQSFLHHVRSANAAFCAEARQGEVRRDTLERAAWAWREAHLKSSCKITGTSGDI